MTREDKVLDVLGLPAQEAQEPRFFIDHGMIYDRVTGKHGEWPFEDDLLRVLALLNSLTAPPRGNYEDRHPNDMILHPLSEIRGWDEALQVLGIQDSDQTPADAIRELHAEIERLRAPVSSTSREAERPRGPVPCEYPGCEATFINEWARTQHRVAVHNEGGPVAPAER